MKRFDETLDRIDKLLMNMTHRLDLTRQMEDDGKLQACYVQLLRLEDTSERLTLLTRSLPIFTGARSGPEDVAQIIRDVIPVELGYTAEGWFCVRIPLLLPKKESGSVNYIRGFLFPALREFFRDQAPVIHPQNVLIYRHVYDRERPERQYRDHDNIEINMVSDIVAMYALPDDAPKYCAHFYCSAAAAKERTEIYVVPRNAFPRWLAKEPAIPEEGVLLYETCPISTEKHM